MKDESGELYLTPSPRQLAVNNLTVEVPTGCGMLLVTVTYTGNRLYEVFVNHGADDTMLGKDKKNGPTTSPCMITQTHSTARLISLGFRMGINPYKVLGMVEGGDCGMGVFHEQRRIKSCTDAVVYGIRKVMEIMDIGPPDPKSRIQEEKIEEYEEKPIATAGQCPDCGSPLAPENGCLHCTNPACGWDKCGG